MVEALIFYGVGIAFFVACILVFAVIAYLSGLRLHSEIKKDPKAHKRYFLACREGDIPTIDKLLSPTASGNSVLFLTENYLLDDGTTAAPRKILLKGFELACATQQTATVLYLLNNWLFKLLINLQQSEMSSIFKSICSGDEVDAINVIPKEKLKLLQPATVLTLVRKGYEQTADNVLSTLGYDLTRLEAIQMCENNDLVSLKYILKRNKQLCRVIQAGYEVALLRGHFDIVDYFINTESLKDAINLPNAIEELAELIKKLDSKGVEKLIDVIDKTLNIATNYNSEQKKHFSPHINRLLNKLTEGANASRNEAYTEKITMVVKYLLSLNFVFMKEGGQNYSYTSRSIAYLLIGNYSAAWDCIIKHMKAEKILLIVPRYTETLAQALFHIPDEGLYPLLCSEHFRNVILFNRKCSPNLRNRFIDRFNKPLTLREFKALVDGYDLKVKDPIYEFMTKTLNDSETVSPVFAIKDALEAMKQGVAAPQPVV